MDIEDEDGLTPLFHAVRNNDIGMIKALLQAGANLNYASTADNLFLGGTALHQAAAKASVETVCSYVTFIYLVHNNRFLLYFLVQYFF